MAYKKMLEERMKRQLDTKECRIILGNVHSDFTLN